MKYTVEFMQNIHPDHDYRNWNQYHRVPCATYARACAGVRVRTENRETGGKDTRGGRGGGEEKVKAGDICRARRTYPIRQG